MKRGDDVEITVTIKCPLVKGYSRDKDAIRTTKDFLEEALTKINSDTPNGTVIEIPCGNLRWRPCRVKIEWTIIKKKGSNE